MLSNIPATIRLGLIWFVVILLRHVGQFAFVSAHLLKQILQKVCAHSAVITGSRNKSKQIGHLSSSAGGYTNTSGGSSISRLCFKTSYFQIVVRKNANRFANKYYNYKYTVIYKLHSRGHLASSVKILFCQTLRRHDQLKPTLQKRILTKRIRISIHRI
jgi:hypothetical protein